MTITQTARDAVADALSYAVDDDRIRQALSEYTTDKSAVLRQRLRGDLKAFDQAGGRGVELAEEIDSLRIVLAFRKATADDTRSPDVDRSGQ